LLAVTGPPIHPKLASSSPIATGRQILLTTVHEQRTSMHAFRGFFLRQLVVRLYE
jgi:hypothetical protein